MASRAFQILASLFACPLGVVALSVMKQPDWHLAAHHEKEKSLDELAFENGITEPDVHAQLEARDRLRAKGQLLAPNAQVSNNATVCVSLPVFEDVDYIEELLVNFLFFTESSTKVALHLDKNTEYNSDATKRLEALASDRVALTRMRVPIRKIGGSILFAHLLNSKTLEETWPRECEFYVMQASNMWWVRKGMERSVRAHRYAELAIQPKSIASNSGPFWNELQPKALNGWGQPEGAFFPMKMVHNFNEYLDAWLERSHQDFNAVLDVRIYVEAFWLPTYALNFEKNIPEESVGANFALCYRHMVETVANYDKDSVPLNEVKDLIAGKEFIHDAINNHDRLADQYYAVKRVNRDMKHETTKFIIDLSH